MPPAFSVSCLPDLVVESQVDYFSLVGSTIHSRSLSYSFRLIGAQQARAATRKTRAFDLTVQTAVPT